MSSHLVFNDCDEAAKGDVEKYWAKKLPRLQKLLVPYRTDLQEIRLTVYCHHQNPQRSWYQVRGVIHLPTGTLAAEANEKDAHAALDRITDALVAEIKRHKEHVRQDYLYKRKSRPRPHLGVSVPQLERDVESGSQEDFLRRLRPHLRLLANYARRELRILERNGTLHRGEATVGDLLDDVLALAWERFPDRPRDLPLDLWLIDLLDEVLEQWIKQEPRPHVSLEEKAEEVLPDKVPRKEEQEWWTELLGEEETFTVEDLIPDSEGTEVWDSLEAEEQRDTLLSLLGTLPAVQRQAFLLHVLDNYATDEIAMLQDRPESEVKADIEAARQTLRNRLLADGHVQETSPLAGVSGTATEAGGK